MTTLENIQLPQPIAQYVQTASWEHVTDGFSPAQVYRIYTGTHARYLKIVTHESRDSLQAERQALQWLQGKISTPAPIAYTKDAAREYLLTTALPGIHPMHDDFTIAPEKRVTLLANIARKMHTIPHDDDLAVRTPADHLAQVQKIHDTLPDNTTRMHLENMATLLPSLTHSLLVVTHGDFYPVNMRVMPDSGAFIGVLDVGRLALADPYVDLAPLADAITWHMNTKQIPTLFKKYGIALDENKLRFYQWYHKLMAHDSSPSKSSTSSKI